MSVTDAYPTPPDIVCDLPPGEHHWPTARAAALARDGHTCRNCGRGPAAAALVKLLFPAAQTVRPKLGELFWAHCAFPGVEVHHRSPRWVDDTPCRNHVADLVTLCRSCHQVETVRLARARAALRREFGWDLTVVPVPSTQAA